MIHDNVITGLALNDKVRVIVANTTELVRKARDLHCLSNVATAALGRTLTGAVLMSRTLKNESDLLTIQIKGDGPLGGIVTTCDYNSNVKGYVYNPEVELPIRETDGKLDVGGAVGHSGQLQVVKSLGLKEPYVGLVNLISGEIAEDLAYYYASSEQVNSIVALGVVINKDNEVEVGCGYMIQLMPGADEECIRYLEDVSMLLPSVSQLFEECDGDCETVLERLFPKFAVFNDDGTFAEDKENINYRILNKSVCAYECDCSRERMERNLMSLGKKELTELAEEQETTELVCHFCNKKYEFTSKQLMELIS